MSDHLRAVLLDLDGTLLDSVSLLRSVYHQFLAARGRTGTDAEFDRWIGPPIAEMVPALAAAHALEGDARALLDDYLARVAVAYGQATLMPGAAELLRWLAANGVAAAVATSGPSVLARAALVASGVDGLLGAVVGADDGRPGKPAPDVYLTALDALAVEARDALAVEDSAMGIRAARAAGLRCAAVTGTTATFDLIRAGASVVCGGLDEVHALCEGLRVGCGRTVPARRLRVRPQPPPVFSATLEAAVSAAWDAALAARPHMHDGIILSTTDWRLAGDTIELGVEARRYRYSVAEQSGVFNGLRPLAVSGVVRVPSPDGASVVLGRRSPSVLHYPRRWELVPSGGVEARRLAADGALDVDGQLLDELTEELGVPRARVKAVTFLGLVEDIDLRVVDLALCIDLDGDAATGAPSLRPGRDEYDELRILPLAAFETWMTALDVVPTAAGILRLLRAHA